MSAPFLPPVGRILSRRLNGSGRWTGAGLLFLLITSGRHGVCPLLRNTSLISRGLYYRTSHAKLVKFGQRIGPSLFVRLRRIDYSPFALLSSPLLSSLRDEGTRGLIGDNYTSLERASPVRLNDRIRKRGTSRVEREGERGGGDSIQTRW